jgi:type IV secretory pathway VirB2 component (pilin)
MTMPLDPALPVPRAGLGLSWPLLVAGCSFLMVFARGQHLLMDADTYWHIAAGRWMLAHHSIPTVDPFSYTFLGAPWTAHEWLSEIVYAATYAIGGWSAVVAIATAAFVAALAILTRYLLRHLVPIHALAFVALSVALMIPHLLARPHVLAAPVLVGWAVALVRARESNRAPALWLTPLMTLWANLHGSFPFGLALVGAFATEAVTVAGDANARWRAVRQWGVFLITAVLAALMNPRGIYGLVFATDMLHMNYALAHVSEWQSPNFNTFEPLEVLLLVAAAVSLTRGLRLPPLRIVMLLGLLHLSLKHIRHADLLALLAPIVAAQPLASQLSHTGDQANQAVNLDRIFVALARPAKPIASAGVLLMLAVVVMIGIRFSELRPPAGITPEAALSAVRIGFPGGAAPLPGPVLNDYGFGGYLIYVGIRPYIDSRADLYGDAFLSNFARALDLKSPELLPDLLARHHIGWTLLKPDQAAVALLDRLPGWRRFYTDDIAVVHVRSGPDASRATSPATTLVPK